MRINLEYIIVLLILMIRSLRVWTNRKWIDIRRFWNFLLSSLEHFTSSMISVLKLRIFTTGNRRSVFPLWKGKRNPSTLVQSKIWNWSVILVWSIIFVLKEKKRKVKKAFLLNNSRNWKYKKNICWRNYLFLN